MRNKIVLLALLLSAQHAISQVSFGNMESNDRLIVQTKVGQLRGTHQNGVDVFKGIPFASPPVGKFRWRPPQPVTPWEGIRDANNMVLIVLRPVGRVIRG
jgi:para-nitrobenzyl esterase